MAGTVAGGKAAAKKNKELYGEDFYAVQGAKGGYAKGRKKGFAADKERARRAGRIGGQVSRKSKSLTKEARVQAVRDLQSKLEGERSSLKTKRTPVEKTPFSAYKHIDEPIFTSRESKAMYENPTPWYKRLFKGDE